MDQRVLEEVKVADASKFFHTFFGFLSDFEAPGGPQKFPENPKNHTGRLPGTARRAAKPKK